MSVNFTVTAAPHIRNNETTRKIMADVLIALVPALIAAIILFGLRSLVLVVISAAAWRRGKNISTCRRPA